MAHKNLFESIGGLGLWLRSAGVVKNAKDDFRIEQTLTVWWIHVFSL